MSTSEKNKMKHSLSIILIITVTITIAIILFYVFVNDEFSTKIISCGNGFIQRGDECHPDSRLLESNTVLIYPITDESRTRIITVPHDITIYLEKDDKITWINKSPFTATVYDREGMWSTGEFKPSMQKSIQFNKTGFYEYSVDAEDRHHGEIVVISNDTNSLPIEIRMKMGMSMVTGDRDNNPALIGVGIGATVEGVQITINQEELAKHENAESFYYDRYRNLIPFDVPITIEFGEPVRTLTG